MCRRNRCLKHAFGTRRHESSGRIFPFPRQQLQAFVTKRRGSRLLQRLLDQRPRSNSERVLPKEPASTAIGGRRRRSASVATVRLILLDMQLDIDHACPRQELGGRRESHSGSLRQSARSFYRREGQYADHLCFSSKEPPTKTC